MLYICKSKDFFSSYIFFHIAYSFYFFNCICKVNSVHIQQDAALQEATTTRNIMLGEKTCAEVYHVLQYHLNELYSRGSNNISSQDDDRAESNENMVSLDVVIFNLLQ
ncbi:hypothetical protein Hanom_Chr04g00335091 [Helianthus anomalus]